MPTSRKKINADYLLQRGNVGLTRLLVAVNNAIPEGISTVKLLEQLGSTHHAQAFIKRTKREGLIERKEGESEHGQFPPVHNILTEKGKKLLSQLNNTLEEEIIK
jgi:predicted transcriptional regulator